MWIRDIEFPVTDGLVVAALKSGLTAWAPVTVQPKLPKTKTRRMVTVRNDSGPQEGSLSRRRYGVNVWANSSVDAELLANAAMSVLRLLPSGSIKGTDSFSGPYEIEEETPFVVDGDNLTHYYFTFRLTVQGSRPTP